jgi:shikimate kinase
LTVKNIVLIGMPGAGKSTLGLLLAKKLGMDFVDTDINIQIRWGKTLQQIINHSGYQRLRDYEQQVLLELDCINKVIATGGSAVYSDVGMAHLKANSKVIFIDINFQQLTERVFDFNSRGIAHCPDQSFEALFAERRPLYQQYADISIDCNNLSIDQCLYQIVKILPN